MEDDRFLLSAAAKGGDTEAEIAKIRLVGSEGIEFAEGRSIADDIYGFERVGAMDLEDGGEERCEGRFGVAVCVLVDVAETGIWS